MPSVADYEVLAANSFSLPINAQKDLSFSISNDSSIDPIIVLAEPKVPEGATTGWLIRPGDAGALADRLAGALALTGAERWAIAERARAHVLAQFTVESMQLRTLAVYDRLLGTVLERRFREAPTPRAVDVSPRKS